ncbi:MAG: glucose-6-phosphate dehydrogenase assembly protein OpcA [Actinomycetota bacterium]
MIIDLTRTTAAEVGSALSRARRSEGASTVGAVLTLVVSVSERAAEAAIACATDAAREHPCRILVVIPRAPSSSARLDASIHATGPGETVTLRLYGTLGEHADSVVLPLLLPDTPVVLWWPAEAPEDPGASVLGKLAGRRITDAAASPKPVSALEQRARTYTPGDTDFAWSRITPWRATLAAALDHGFDPVKSIEVSGASGNPSVPLLGGWLANRLSVPVEIHATRGPGITGVVLRSEHGQITLTRPDGRKATLNRTGSPARMVALARRTDSECLAEELRRLDPDEPYAESVAAVSTVSRARPRRRT